MDYPIHITSERGLRVATCPDLPEVRAEAPDEAALLLEAADAVERALIERMTRFETVPDPSPSEGPCAEVSLPTQLMVRLHQALRDSGTTRADIARALDQHRASVDRVFNPKHGSNPYAVDRVLHGLGRRFVVRTELARPGYAPRRVSFSGLFPKSRAKMAGHAGFMVLAALLIAGSYPDAPVIKNFFEARSVRYAVETRLPYWRETRPDSLRPTKLEPDGDASIILADTRDAILKCEAGVNLGVSSPYAEEMPLRTPEARAAADAACQEAAALAQSVPWDFRMPEDETTPQWVKAYLPPAILNAQQDPARPDREQRVRKASEPGSELRILSRSGMRVEIAAAALGPDHLICMGPTPSHIDENGERVSSETIISEEATAAAARICAAALEAQSR